MGAATEPSGGLLWKLPASCTPVPLGRAEGRITMTLGGGGGPGRWESGKTLFRRALLAGY